MFQIRDQRHGGNAREQLRCCFLRTIIVLVILVTMYGLYKLCEKYSDPLYSDLTKPPGSSGVFLEGDSTAIKIAEPVLFYGPLSRDHISEHESVQLISDWLAEFLQPFQSVIIDCPGTFYNNDHYSNLVLKAVVSFDRVSSFPVQVWLRSVSLRENTDNGSCVNLAVKTNNMFPGTIRGILGNTAELMMYTKNPKAFYPFQRFIIWKPYSQRYFDKLDGQGLKFGLLLNPSYCNPLIKRVPGSIIAKFDKIFYFEDDALQQLMSSKNVLYQYNECKDTILKKAANVTVKYAVAKHFDVHSYKF